MANSTTLIQQIADLSSYDNTQQDRAQFSTYVSSMVTLNNKLYMGLAVDVIPFDTTLSAANQPPANSREYSYRLYEYTPSTGVLARVPGVEPNCQWPGGYGTFVPGDANNIGYSPYEVSDLFVYNGSIYFNGNTGNCYGREMWRWSPSDGFEMLADLSSYDPNQQGYAQYSTYVSSMVTLNDKVCVCKGERGR